MKSIEFQWNLLNNLPKTLIIHWKHTNTRLKKQGRVISEKQRPLPGNCDNIVRGRKVDISQFYQSNTFCINRPQDRALDMRIRPFDSKLRAASFLFSYFGIYWHRFNEQMFGCFKKHYSNTKKVTNRVAMPQNGLIFSQNSLQSHFQSI